MQTEKTKKTALCIFCWALVAACMITIFYFSSRTASESTEQSNFIIELLKRLFGESFVLATDRIVRKCAHFLEFTGLGLLFGIALFAQTEKQKTALAILCTSAYAITDEVHQIFVEGRACRFIDWVIDTAGGALGAIAFLIILLLIRKTAGKNKKAIDS